MSTAFAYALPRMHARMAERADERARKRLAAVDDFGHFVQLAARGGFGPWLKNLGTTSGVHAVEYALREAYRARLGELAGWLSRRWRPAVEWLALAPDLPVLAELLQQGRRAEWMALDPKWSRLPTEPGKLRQTLLEHWPELEPFGDDRLAEAWLERARILLPPLNKRTARMLEALLQAHLELADADRLIKLFRRESAAPVRVFAWTGLERLDFEFLRGHLVRRRLQMREAA
ncbi:MAG: hypothetical protein KGY53_12070 [Wenzhouxiangellaceae bacterium]|nr:hypothetical protein [Wenzhouxiangellaceae bacterium]